MCETNPPRSRMPGALTGWLQNGVSLLCTLKTAQLSCTYTYIYTQDRHIRTLRSFCPKLEEIAGRSRSSINTCATEAIASPFKKLMSLGLVEKTFYLRRCSCWVWNIKSSPSVAVGAGERFSTRCSTFYLV